MEASNSTTMSHNQDQQTVDKVLSGNTRAFEALVEQYKHMVYTVALKMVKNREDAEEVAQDVFIKAFTALRTFKGESKFSTWLYKITYYSSLDYLKKRRRKLEYGAIEVSEAYDITTLETAMDYLEAEDRRLMIKEGMAALPAEDEVLLTLYYFEELSLKEISKIMDINTNTAKVRLFRGRARLAELLIQSMEPEILREYGRK